MRSWLREATSGLRVDPGIALLDKPAVAPGGVRRPAPIASIPLWADAPTNGHRDLLKQPINLFECGSVLLIQTTAFRR